MFLLSFFHNLLYFIERKDIKFIVSYLLKKARRKLITLTCVIR